MVSIKFCDLRNFCWICNAKQHDFMSTWVNRAISLTYVSPVLHFIQKSFIWFAVQVKWLASLWNATLAWNGLIKVLYLYYNSIWNDFFSFTTFRKQRENFIRLFYQIFRSLLFNSLPHIFSFISLSGIALVIIYSLEF